MVPLLVRRGFGGTTNNSHDKNAKTNNVKTATATTQVASGSKTTALEPVYVHPLSQIVLLYLQEQCHEWIIDQRLDGLQIQRDGTFVLEFPAPNDAATARIWTFYDSTDKKHWLAFSATNQQQRQANLRHRFLLQDNLMPAWNGNTRQSLPDRVEKAVSELMLAVNDEMER